MKKIVTMSLVIVLVLMLGAGVVFAGGDSIPSAKTAAAMDYVGKADLDWETILTVPIKTGTPKDLIIDVSLESSLTTNVKLRGDEGSAAAAGVAVRVLVDGQPVLIPDNPNPGNGVIFNNRLLKLEGDLKHLDTLEQDHWIQIFMTTKSANAFNFIAEDVGPGVSVVEVQVKTWYRESNPRLAYATGLVGNACVVVE